MLTNPRRPRARDVRGGFVAIVIGAFLTFPAAAAAVDVACDAAELSDPHNVPLSTAETAIDPFALEDPLLGSSELEELSAGEVFSTDAFPVSVDAEGTGAAFPDDSPADASAGDALYVDGVEARPT